MSRSRWRANLMSVTLTKFGDSFYTCSAHGVAGHSSTLLIVPTRTPTFASQSDFVRAVKAGLRTRLVQRQSRLSDRPGRVDDEWL